MPSGLKTTEVGKLTQGFTRNRSYYFCQHGIPAIAVKIPVTRFKSSVPVSLLSIFHNMLLRDHIIQPCA